MIPAMIYTLRPSEELKWKIPWISEQMYCTFRFLKSQNGNYIWHVCMILRKFFLRQLIFLWLIWCLPNHCLHWNSEDFICNYLQNCFIEISLHSSEQIQIFIYKFTGQNCFVEICSSEQILISIYISIYKFIGLILHPWQCWTNSKQVVK